ncbi:TRAP transporter small permease subunit [Vibrio nigripulchritudo]|uniref:TRAP transporter small permease subunit n=1 Tax=Vibrio nigripulchritudo TaxID=28173 RepID=UPI0003B197B3|nr:TRAP transporter small permease [Vibrio nigripulchritudo]BDU39152.1 hypothetical protein TUMSATVNIG2_36210 [Vibrio nigripulchritudo]BDU44872.1 hypothetical protein TUMSATVNIG3_36700 [Vibrio nigripulchritudo]CCN73605.1 TRAP dicarboxylate family transporter, DctQ subunit [Vibrio nigripulchritudo SFn118]
MSKLNSSALNRNDVEKPSKEVPEDAMAKQVRKIGLPFAILFLATTAILIFEVIMRYVFSMPTIWVHETAVFLCAINFLFGGLYVAAKNAHIRIVLLYDWVPNKVRRILDVIIYGVCCAVTASFSWALWPTVVKSVTTPAGDFRLITSGSAWNPPYPALLRIFLFVVLIALSIQFFIFTINKIRGK